MSTNFLYAQAPNRKGNQSKHPAELSGGVTTVTRPSGGVAYAAGHQGAPAAGKSVTSGRGQKVAVSRPKEDYCHNDGYRSSSFLK